MFTFGVTRIENAHFHNHDELKEIMSKVSELTAIIDAMKQAGAEQLTLVRKLVSEQAELLDRLTRVEDELAAREEIPASLLAAAAEVRDGQVQVGRVLLEIDTLFPDLTPVP